MKIFKHLQSTKNGCKYVIIVTSFLEYMKLTKVKKIPYLHNHYANKHT